MPNRRQKERALSCKDRGKLLVWLYQSRAKKDHLGHPVPTHYIIAIMSYRTSSCISELPGKWQFCSEANSDMTFVFHPKMGMPQGELYLWWGLCLSLLTCARCSIPHQVKERSPGIMFSIYLVLIFVTKTQLRTGHHWARCCTNSQ